MPPPSFPVHIERLNPADEPEVRALLVDLTFEEQPRYAHPTHAREHIAHTTPGIAPTFTGDNHVLVARTEQDGEIAGFCWLVVFDPGTGLEAEVAELYVRPDHRCGGVARALLDEAMAEFRRRSVTFASVWTHDTNPGAIALYRAAGFAPTEQQVLTWLPLDVPEDADVRSPRQSVDERSSSL